MFNFWKRPVFILRECSAERTAEILQHFPTKLEWGKNLGLKAAEPSSNSYPTFLLYKGKLYEAQDMTYEEFSVAKGRLSPGMLLQKSPA